jgi:phosphate/sulfate permease
MMCVALLGGMALSYASHLHGSPVALERALYGAYLGAVMAHFVIDAGLWRLRDEFPRAFMTAHLPYLLRP